MSKKIALWLQWIGITSLGMLIVFVFPYYQNDSNLTMRLIDFDPRLSSMLIVLSIGLFILYCFGFIVSKISPSMLDTGFGRNLMIILPEVLGVMVLVNFIFMFFVISDYNLGSNFTSVNYDFYGNVHTQQEIIDVGANIEFSTGFYMMYVFLIGYVVQFLWYYKNLSKIFT